MVVGPQPHTWVCPHARLHAQDLEGEWTPEGRKTGPCGWDQWSGASRTVSQWGLGWGLEGKREGSGGAGCRRCGGKALHLRK